jgi:D-psicose/D-tagatose/L-ribulose 3-epimerase
MQYGAHSFIFTERWTDDSLHILDQVRDLGLACFEIGIGDDVAFNPALTARRAASLGLMLTTSPGGAWPVQFDLSSDEPSERRAGLDWHRRQVDRTAAMGATAYTGALYGHPGTVRRRRLPTEERSWTAEGLHALAEYAAAQQVQIVIEPMSHFRTHLVNTPEQAVYLIDLAQHDNLHILLDTYHLITEIRDYVHTVLTAAPRLWGIHACENDRGAPGGGLVPWQQLFSALHQIRFDGVILMESYNSSIGDFAHQRGMFHDVCPDGAEFVRRGLAFLQRGLSARA